MTEYPSSKCQVGAGADSFLDAGSEFVGVELIISRSCFYIRKIKSMKIM